MCMIDLVTVSNIFPGTRKSLKRWKMLEFPMSSYFVWMPIPIEWSQGKFVSNRQDNRNFLHGAQKGSLGHRKGGCSAKDEKS